MLLLYEAPATPSQFLTARAFRPVEGLANRLGQTFRRPGAPVIEEEDPGLLVEHMIMNGDNLNSSAPERPDHPIYFLCRHGHISGDVGLLIRAHKSGPGVQAHVRSNLRPAHLYSRTSDRDLKNAAAGLTLMADDLLQALRIQPK